MGIKRALSVGINYPGTYKALKGCVNDSITIEKMLREKFGFEDITVVLDNDATTARIKEELNKLVAGTKPGDVIFFHYSGHGSQMIDDKFNGDEADGLDEVICPVDFDWKEKIIRDDDLKEIFDKVPHGVNLTVFLDCCNSGGGFDAANEYIVEEAAGEPEEGGRYLPPPPDIAARIKARKLQPKTRALSRDVDNTGMLISGCQANQTSADAFIDGKYQGATTYYLKRTIDELGTSASYKQIVDMLNHFMRTYNFSQRPQLDGPEALHGRAFLSAYDFGNIPEPVQPIVVPIKPAPETTVVKPKKDDDKGSKKTMLIVGGVVVVAAIIGMIFGLG